MSDSNEKLDVRSLKLGQPKPFFNPHEQNKLSTKEYLELLGLMAGCREALKKRAERKPSYEEVMQEYFGEER